MSALRRLVPAAAAASVLAVCSVLTVLTVPVLTVPEPTAFAAATSCPQAPQPGVALPATAPRDPLLDVLGLDSAWALSPAPG